MIRGARPSPALFASLAALVLSTVVSPAAEGDAPGAESVFYLSPGGDDRWTGRASAPLADGSDGPLASFEAARDAARATAGRDRIVVRGGDYRLRATVAFDERDAGLAITAAEGEFPVLFGGIEAEGWREVGEGGWTARIDLTDGVGVHDLFVDGQRQHAARHPNAPVDGDPRRGWLFVRPPTPDEEPLGNAQFRANTGDLPHLEDPGGVVAHVVGGPIPGMQWASDTLPVQSIDRDQGIVRVGGTGYFFTGTGSRYFLAGAEAFLDAPGEWWFDDRAGLLHYIARPGVSPPRTRVTVALLPTFLRFTGADDVLVSGLEFREGAPEGSGKHGTHMRGFGAVRLEGSDRARIVGNRFENVGVAIHVSESAGVSIAHNEIAHVAGNAIYFGTEYGTFGRSDDGEIIGNRIRDVGEVYFESAGVWFQAADRLRVAHNTIEGAAQFGIAGGSLWGDEDASHHVAIEHNTVRGANRLTADGGAIKMIGAQATPLRSVIRYNVVTGTDQLMARPEGGFWPPRFEDTQAWPSPISWAIYLDGRASGVSIIGNWLDRNVAGIGINGGWSNVVRRNVILGGAGCAFRVDDATGRGWRPDWIEANRIEENFARIERTDGCAVDVNAPGHGSGYVRFADNRFTGALGPRSFRGVEPPDGARRPLALGELARRLAARLAGIAP